MVFDASQFHQVENNDMVCWGTTKLSEIIKATNSIYKLDMYLGNEYSGELSIIPEHSHDSLIDYKIRLRISASDLEKGMIKNSLDPFLVIERKILNTGEHPIYTSEPVLDKSSPYWKDIIIPLYHWCNGDLNQRITFKVMDFNSSFFIYPHRYIGEVEIPTIELLNPSRIDFDLFSELYSEKTGILHFMRVEILDKNNKYVPDFIETVLKKK